MNTRKDVLHGTADEVEGQLERLSKNFVLYEYMAGTQFRALAAMLSQNPGLRVSVVTYENESQELEVRLADSPGSDALVIDRNGDGTDCQVQMNQWRKISTASEIEQTAKLIAALLRVVADMT